MPAADAGQHGRDMAVADLERLTELSVAPGDAGQAPLEGGDRKLRAAAFDLRSEVEADRFRVGRRLGKPLAAQPRGELSPVGGVGALGVVGLGGAGVGLGGLRQRRQAAAEAAGGREQGRGVRAGSLGLRRHAFRLSAVRAVPDAFVRIALRVGWRAGVGRGGAAVGADQRAQGGGAWRGGLAPPGGRAAASVRPGAPGLRFRRAESRRLVRDGFQSIGCAAGPAPRRLSARRQAAAGKGGAGEGAPAAADPDASLRDASARSRDQRTSAASGPMARGLGLRPTAGPRQAARAGGGRPLQPALRAAFSDASAASKRVSSSAFGSRPGALRAEFSGVFAWRSSAFRTHVR